MIIRRRGGTGMPRDKRGASALGSAEVVKLVDSPRHL